MSAHPSSITRPVFPSSLTFGSLLFDRGGLSADDPTIFCPKATIRDGLARHCCHLSCGRQGVESEVPAPENKHEASQEAGKLERIGRDGSLPMSPLHSPAPLSNPGPVNSGGYRRPRNPSSGPLYQRKQGPDTCAALSLFYVQSNADDEIKNSAFSSRRLRRP